MQHLTWWAMSLLVTIFNSALIIQSFPTEWKHASVISIPKAGKNPALTASYRPISLLDTIGKVFENILPARILKEVTGGGRFRDEQFGFRTKHRTF